MTKKRKILNVLQHYQQFFHNNIGGLGRLLTIQERPLSQGLGRLRSYM